MSTERSSLARAFEAMAEDAGHMGAAVSAEQLDLLRDERGKLPGNVFQLVRENERQRGPGRPAGSRNRRSDDLARLYLSKYPDPVLAMGALANTPLDQLIETILIADSTVEREERLFDLIDRAEAMIAEVMKGLSAGVVSEATIDKVTAILDRIFDAAKALKMKPGDLAIKALNLTLAAQRSAAEYIHSKKPVAMDVTHRVDGVILAAPMAPAGATFDQRDELIRKAGEGIARMLADGRIDPAMIANYRMVDGQLVDAEFTEVDDDGGDK